MKRQRLYFIILAVMVNTLFSGCEGLAELAHGPKPEPEPPPVTYATTYTVTYSINEGSGTAPAAQTASSGSTITLPSGSGLSRTSYTFGGWNTNASGTGTNYSGGSSYTVTGNVTLYARWIAAGTTNYTVTFNINSGSGTTPAGQTVSSGSAITLPSGSGLSRTGYTFGGWNTNAAGTGTNYNAGSSYTVTDTVTLYAKWNVVTYTVTFNVNGATSGTAPTAQTAGSGSSITLPSGSGLSRTNYTFGGWNTDASGTGTNYNADSSYTVTGTVTLYAKWNTNYTVTFNANGATSGTAPAAQTAGSGSTITLPSGSELTRSGYTFGGWNTNTSGTGTNYNVGSSYTVNGNVTLYAKWDTAGTISYTVTFNSNGGSAVQAQTVASGGKATEPQGVTRTNYVLDGWYTNESLTNRWDFANDTISTGITLYAKWNINRYTITFNADGGTPVPIQQTVDHGGKLTEPAAMTKTGYAFDGWYGETAFTNKWDFANNTVTDNVTLYAKWNVITYTVTFNINSGSGTTPSAQTANSGSAITLPSGSGLSRTGYTFGGWNANTSGTGTNYSAGSSYTVTGNVTLYAYWDTNVPGATLAAKLSWLQTNAISNVDYTVEVSANESISPTTLSFSGKTNVGITLRGTGAVRTVSLTSNGAMFTVESGVTLTLDNNITLQGRSDNTSSLVRVNSGGRLIMNTGSCITNNTALGSTTGYGGGVFMNGGTFTMSGGTISGNTSFSYGGGVYINSGTFTMSGGTISGNTTTRGGGGGVSVSSGGTFTMSGGTISGNTTSYSGNVPAYGGGVCVFGTFTKTGGTIYGYSASDTVNSNVVKNGSTVQSNQGHAVYVMSSNPVKRRETTAWPANNMDSSRTGTAGGWDN
jgi:uncharacterized repeat protein (TIGR02543 family)